MATEAVGCCPKHHRIHNTGPASC